MFKIFAERPKSEKPTEKSRIYGTLTVKVFDRNGVLKAVRGPVRNLIVNGGYDYICNQLGSALSTNSAQRSCRWTGVGHSGTAVAATQTNLLSHKYRKRNLYTHTSGTKYYSCVATFTSFGGFTALTVYESGLFWQSGSGANVMLCRQTFAAVSKLTADTLIMEWKLSLS